MDNSDIFNRIFDKLDRYDDRLNTTCNTMTEIKTTLTDFINSVNKREIETRNSLEKRYKNMAVLFGSITSVSVIIGIGRVFGVI